MQTIRKYFISSILALVIGVAIAAVLGYAEGQSTEAALQLAITALLLAGLEISISFDNAVVNAKFLNQMSPIWRRRFLVWGMLIAVFGMRLVFPVMIVSISTWISPLEALRLATFQPGIYAEKMLAVHHEVSAFGGAFLLLVFLKFFLDHEKDHHWLSWIEKPLARLGAFRSFEIAIALLCVWIFTRGMSAESAYTVFAAGVAGILTSILVDCLGAVLDQVDSAKTAGAQAGLGMFLYLEVLDASFSFDGVIGAFAITNNLWIILIGLGVGAFFVRSLTLLMVDRGTLKAFAYMEHGAFWAVGALAAIMFFSLHMEIPEWIAGLAGVSFIGVAIASSLGPAKKT